MFFIGCQSYNKPDTLCWSIFYNTLKKTSADYHQKTFIIILVCLNVAILTMSVQFVLYLHR